MAFFLAGLQGVSQDQIDAARVDGCENMGVLMYVVLPHLAPTMIIVTILGAMGHLQAFDVIYALTQGGPIKATTMLSIEVYKQAFQNWDMGTACAVGVLWFVTIAVPTTFYLRILFRRENCHAETADLARALRLLGRLRGACGLPVPAAAVDGHHLAQARKRSLRAHPHAAAAGGHLGQLCQPVQPRRHGGAVA
jgi:ABC-type Fe3+ transport system permease subunit